MADHCTVLHVRGFRGKVVLTAHNADDVRLLAQQGLDFVLRPFSATADALAVPTDRRD